MFKFKVNCVYIFLISMGFNIFVFSFEGKPVVYKQPTPKVINEKKTSYGVMAESLGSNKRGVELFIFTPNDAYFANIHRPWQHCCIFVKDNEIEMIGVPLFENYEQKIYALPIKDVFVDALREYGYRRVTAWNYREVKEDSCCM